MKKVVVTVFRRNDTVDFSDLLETVGAYNEKIGGSKTKVVTQDAAGLDVSGAIDALSDGGDGGNQEITFDGLDHAGNRLAGGNEDFSVKVEIKKLPNSTAWRAKALYRAMRNLVAGRGLRDVPIRGDFRQRVVDLTK